MRKKQTLTPVSTYTINPKLKLLERFSPIELSVMTEICSRTAVFDMVAIEISKYL